LFYRFFRVAYNVPGLGGRVVLLHFFNKKNFNFGFLTNCKSITNA
jgi:hypothetical protein